jgi:polysaccharide pyruvyl transferase WcaK-like protein
MLDKEKINDINIVFCTDYDEINNFFKDKDLVIGSRIHASIIALNNGIPAICTNCDSRVFEMCELFKIPHINSIENLGNKNIYEIINSINFEEINNNFNILKKEHDIFLTKIFE